MWSAGRAQESNTDHYISLTSSSFFFHASQKLSNKSLILDGLISCKSHVFISSSSFHAKRLFSEAQPAEDELCLQ